MPGVLLSWCHPLLHRGKESVWHLDLTDRLGSFRIKYNKVYSSHRMKLSQNSRQQWWFWPKFLPSGFLRSQMKPTKQNQKWHWRGQMTDQHEFPIDVLKPCTATGIPINTSQCYIPAYAKNMLTHTPTNYTPVQPLWLQSQNSSVSDPFIDRLAKTVSHNADVTGPQHRSFNIL